jgi:2-dehydro-3-deoxyglucarate aldolase
MPTSEFRDRLRRGDLLVGTMLTLTAPPVAELLAAAGYDWLFIDAEHSVFEARDVQAALQAAAPIPGVVRLATAAEVPIKQALDVGAAGIIAPQVNTVELAEQVVSLAKYAPTGTRGVGIGRAHGYGLGLSEYIRSANEQTAVIVQIEHITGVHNVEAIVRVPGIDAVLVGPYDLSASLNRMGEVDHPDVRQAIDHVTAVCKAAGMPLGIFGVGAAAVQPYIARGYTLIVAGVDTLLLGQGAQALLQQVRTAQQDS